MPDVPPDTCVVCCYHDPAGNPVRRSNFERFHRSLTRRDIPVYVAELVHPGQCSALWDSVGALYAVPDVSVLWQKERLLNRLVAMLPSRYGKVVWSDVDMLMGADGLEPLPWIVEMARSLDRSVVAQGFSTVARLPRPGRTEEPDIVEGIVARWVGAGRPGRLSSLYAEHGHTGYVWGARRDFLEECGLYDSCLSGSGDHLMAHAFLGDLDSDCFRKVFRTNETYRDHFMTWAERAATRVDGRIGFVDRRLTHLWHAEPQNRRYRERDIELAAMDFDPGRDLVLDRRGSWTWSARGARLRGWAGAYLAMREG